MDTTGFEEQLRADGYDDVSHTGFPAGHDLPVHAHPYDLRGLIVEGEFTIGVDGGERTYHVGEVFELSAATDHAERTGPVGVRFLIGRRHLG